MAKLEYDAPWHTAQSPVVGKWVAGVVTSALPAVFV